MIAAGRFAALAGLLLLLTGCWIGPRFYAARDSLQLLSLGSYRVAESERDFSTARISMRDGLTIVVRDADSSEEIVLGFAPLDPDRQLFVAWLDIEGPDGLSVPYLLAQRLADDDVRFYYPSCRDSDRRVATAAGGRVLDGGRVCAFETREQLETALRNLTSREVVGRVTRIDDPRR